MLPDTAQCSFNSLWSLRVKQPIRKDMIHHSMSVHSAWFLREIHTSLSYSGYKNKDHTNAQTSKRHFRTVATP